MPAESGRAVFLSYASQDAESARRICETLRSAGVEVWFDADGGLEHGDEWDAKIRKQIKDCVLFIPIISANTQARHEGYFRIEWELAAQRAMGIASGVPFILPVVIDDTREPEALVPDRFRAVQWTRLRAGEIAPDVRARFLKLWSHRIGAARAGGSGEARGDSGEETGNPSRPGLAPDAGRRGPGRRWLLPVMVGVIAVGAAVASWAFFLRPKSATGLPKSPVTAATAVSSELASLRARIVPDRWTRGDYEVIKSALDRLILANQEEAEAWALRSIIASLQVVRTFDYGTSVLMAGKTDAERALRLAPGLPLGDLALGLHYVAMTTRGGDARAASPPIARAVRALPRDALTRYVELADASFTLRLAEAEELCLAWLQDDPAATFPLWVLAGNRISQRSAADAESWAERAAQADKGITGVRALVTLCDIGFFLRADLSAARTAIDRVPAESRSIHRVVLARWQLALVERRWDEAIQELVRVPDAVLYDRTYHGPKALLAGIAHHKAGRAAPAAAQLAEAERALRELLRGDPDDEDFRTALALTLAYAGRTKDARDELAALEPLVRGRPEYLYSGFLQARMAETFAVLGDVDAMLPWLRLIFAGPSTVPYTPASFRLDPRFEAVANDPRVQALLKEFTPPAPPAGAEQKSVAVLAFKTLGADRESEYFSEGISGELLNVLAKVPGLRVAAPASSFYFKDKPATTQEMGRKLNVAYLVDGSVQRMGTTARVVARLSRAETGEQIWSDRFEGELKNIFALQDQIAGAIAQNLSLKLRPSATAVQEVNPEAHRLLLVARHFWALRTGEAFARAETALVAAAGLTPDWAPVQSALADLWTMEALYSALNGVAQPEKLDRAEAAARRAIALLPTESQPYAALGEIAMARQRWTEAEPHFRKALELSPHNATALDWYGDLLEETGRLDLALEQYRKAEQIDPLSYFILSDVNASLSSARRYREILPYVERTEALAPGRVRTGVIWADALSQLGRREEARTRLLPVLSALSAGQEAYLATRAIQLLRELGEPQKARELGDAVLRTTPRQHPLAGLVLIALGRKDEGFASLEHATEPAILGWLVYWGREFDDIRDDPRFRRFLEKSKYAENYAAARASLARVMGEERGK